jgi:hypothetical protein
LTGQLLLQTICVQNMNMFNPKTATLEQLHAYAGSLFKSMQQGLQPSVAMLLAEQASINNQPVKRSNDDQVDRKR